MNVFVAGGTGVLGRAALPALRERGHGVRATARGADNAALARRLGAEPVEVDLDDRLAVRRAVAGSDAIVRLTTKIPSLFRMGRRGAWTETNRLRTAGARVLIDAAVREGVRVYVHESVAFVYADGGASWHDEDARTDDGGTGPLRAALEGEREALRFAGGGRRGIVLRFGGFYGPDSPSAQETVQLLRRRMLPQIGPGTNYFSSIYVADAGRAVAASLTVPTGVYNVCDDDPVPFAGYLEAAAQAAGAPRPWRLPAWLGPVVFGEIARYFFRSLRVSNRRLKEAAGWRPEVPSALEGWPRVAGEWGR